MKKIYTAICLLTAIFGMQAQSIQQRFENRVAQTGATMHKAPAAKAAADYPIITAAPAGETKTYTRSGGSYYYDNNSGVQQVAQDGLSMVIVFADDNKVYLKDIISNEVADTWVEGTLSADGKTITVPLGQYIYYMADYDIALCIGIIDFNTTTLRGTVDTTATEVTLSIADDGTVSLEGTSVTRLLGGVYKTQNSYYSSYNDTYDDFGDYESVYTPTVLETVTPPATLETAEYEFTGTSYMTKEVTTLDVNVGFNGEDVYMQGILAPQQLPEAWAKGTLDTTDGSLNFPVQYMGLNNGTLYYLAGYNSGLAELKLTPAQDEEDTYTAAYLMVNAWQPRSSMRTTTPTAS